MNIIVIGGGAAGLMAAGTAAEQGANGKGKTVFRNGDVYEGEYVKGKRQGEGTYTFSDGEKYVGECNHLSINSISLKIRLSLFIGF